SLPQEKKDLLQKHFDESIIYSQKVGNIYTGSLFLGLLSLLENSDSLKAGDKIALNSYGSGAVSEFFSVELVEGFEKQLRKNRLDLLDQRQALSVADYERFFFEEANLDESGSATMSGYEGQD
ncbi:hydroxymethylglutaryl-CoA synthase, partial [Streptococcus pneumoniae]|uniref:hydroxymethylglutaryl-CoA synthase n=1 Tax=Streptococcus pneumoniae TaxID=1313 RepID=UPI001307778B